jgi:hypothetical protein
MKRDLSDTTFTIPVRIDHPDRLRNLTIVVNYLKHHFRTNIIIGESDKEPKLKNIFPNCGYIFYEDESELFHRTKILNDLARASTTPVIANYDADILADPTKIEEAVNLIRMREADMVYPYGGNFRNVIGDNITKVKAHLSISMLNESNTQDIHPSSFGGAILWNKYSFIENGMENERFISWGLEDNERFERAKKLGLKVFRVSGILYHLDHWRGNNSHWTHTMYKNNEQEYVKQRNMNKDELRKYIQTWEWL